MKNICCFIHFSRNNSIDYPEQYYIKELSKQFSEVHVYTNERPFKSIDLGNNVSYFLEKNEGYDFGFFTKFWSSINPSDYEEIV